MFLKQKHVELLFFFLKKKKKKGRVVRLRGWVLCDGLGVGYFLVFTFFCFLAFSFWVSVLSSQFLVLCFGFLLFGFFQGFEVWVF